MRSLILILSLAVEMRGAVVLDRIAVVAGKHAIKSSDIERDLRITEFLNRAPLDVSSAAKRKAAERLIDQSVIRDEITANLYDRATDADADRMMAEIRQDRYGGSDARLRQALALYGLTEDELHEALLWQLTVLRFIDQRFRPAVLITDEQVRAYYDQHLNELKREYPRDYSFATLQTKIRNLLEGQEIDKQFDTWLDEARKREHIVYHQEAFG